MIIYIAKCLDLVEYVTEFKFYQIKHVNVQTSNDIQLLIFNISV